MFRSDIDIILVIYQNQNVTILSTYWFFGSDRPKSTFEIETLKPYFILQRLV